MKIRRIDFYPTDWLEGTAELRDDECGVYIRACALIYARGGPITEELLKRSSTSHGNAFNRILNRLESLGKLIRNGSEITQKRCGNELERARKRVENASENGSKGNEIRWKAVATRSQDRIANKQHTTNNIHQTSVRNARESRFSFAEEFAEFWQVWPTRVGKSPALKAFTKAIGKASLATIIDGVRRYVRHKPADRAWLNPATWLNQERWNDEYENGHANGFSEPAGPRSPAPTLLDLGYVQEAATGRWVRPDEAK